MSEDLYTVLHMSEKGAHFESAEERAEKYRFVKDPNYFTSGDAFRARFVDVEKAVKDNPEKRGVASAILAACYMAFGSERVDLKRLGSDVLLPRLNGYLVAYNDQVDIAKKIKESDPDVYELIMNHVAKFKEKLDAYFQPTGDQKEDVQRQDFKQFYDVAFAEVDSVEHELFTVKAPKDAEDKKTITEETERIHKGRELVNAIEMLMNIRACVGSDIFSDRKIDESGSLDIAGLSQKYDWLINPDYDDSELTEDEAKARMLFFSTMSNQLALDEIDYKEDRCFAIWKKMTYMTEVQKLSPKEAAKIMQIDSAQYADLANKYGMSPLPIIAANKGARVFSHIKNLMRGFVAKKAEKRGHIRELAVATLQKKHPNKYKM